MNFMGKVLFLLALLYMAFNPISAQNPALADSLIELYQAGEPLKDELGILKTIANNHPNPDKKLKYAEILISKAAEDSVYEFLHTGYLQRGNALQLKGNFAPALDSYFISLNYANLLNDQKGIGAANISIANTYSILGNYQTSERYYDRGITILREVNDSITLGSALLNAGDDSFNSENYDEALEYYSESGLIFEAIDYPLGQGFNLGNVGMVYAAQGKQTLAKKNINEAIDILEELEQYYPIAVYLSTIADIYAQQKNIPAAFDYAKRSHDLATRYGLKDQIGDSYLQMANLYEAAGNYKEAYNAYKNYIVYRDSVANLQTIQEMAELRTDYEISQKQTEVDLLAQQKANQKIIVISTGIAFVLLGLLAFGLYRRNKYINKMRKVLGNEKDRSDRLLLNILPEQTARELKEFGRVKSQRFESVTVLFADFKDFTYHSEYLDPELLVESVDFYFSRFDEITEKYGLEKIKTVGDCYLCAGGLPHPSRDHANSILLAALEMTEFVKEAKKNQKDSDVRFDIRVGINTGPVVAGVVGSKKFAYDIWGDAVNIASRMETNSEAGRINISENTYNLVKFHFDCEYRGEVEVKSKGIMKMYYVNGIKDFTLKHNTGSLVRPGVQV